jgi:azurin
MKHLKIIVAAVLAFQAPFVLAAAKETKLSLASKGDAMEFTKTKLTAKPGAKVSLTFTNNASKSSGLQHNFVLTQPGAAEKVANDGLTAGADHSWIKDSDQIIAHTKLLNAGEKETITFTAPEKEGDYPYVCTFPGHSAMMKGVLTVKK